MNNIHLDKYYDEERSMFLGVLDRIRTFCSVLFFVGIVILNYSFYPAVLVYPWILLLYVVYTIYKLIYPFGVFGYFGEKVERRAKGKLVREVDDREDKYEKWKKRFHAKMEGRDPL